MILTDHFDSAIAKSPRNHQVDWSRHKTRISLNLDNFRYCFFSPLVSKISWTRIRMIDWLFFCFQMGWSYHQTCTCNPFTCCCFFRCCCWRLESWNAVANPGGGELLSRVVGREKRSTLKSWVIPKGFPILAAIFRSREILLPMCLRYVWFLVHQWQLLGMVFWGDVSTVQSFKAHQGTTWMMSWKAWN